MKCFVHVGFDPEPHEAPSPQEAVEYAIKRLEAEEALALEVGEEPLSVKWRRDDLYPDNFLEYTVGDLVAYLQEKGEVALQLVNIGEDGLPTMGEIANIFTAAEEEKNVQEAQEALDKLGASLAASYKTPVTLTSAGQSRTFKPGETSPVVTTTPKRKPTKKATPTTKRKTAVKKPVAAKKKKTLKSSTIKRRSHPAKKATKKK